MKRILPLMLTIWVSACGSTAPISTPAFEFTQTAVPSLSFTPVTFSDPIAYCAAIGTINGPDDRYTGPRIPDSVVTGLRQALNLPLDTADPDFAKRSWWRCMDGKVYACYVGENTPCTAKAGISEIQNTSQAVKDYCQANPSADTIPETVQPSDIIYQWGCKDGEPVIVKELVRLDSEGFIADIWHELSTP
jgi:hypothetical protein